MSSHHFVRENQEPALVIFDARAISFESVQQLLEWMPTIVVLHTEIETVLGWGIKVDVVLVPANESMAWIERIQDQQPIEAVLFQANESAVDRAIFFLQSRNIPAVNWLMPDTASLSLVSDVKSDTEVFVHNIRWSRVKSGLFEKWVPAGTVLHVFPPTASPTFQQGRLVVEKDGVMVLEAPKLFWVGEELPQE